MRTDGKEIERKFKLVGLKSVHEVSHHSQNELIKHLEAALTFAAVRDVVILADTFCRQAGTDFYWRSPLWQPGGIGHQEVRVRYDTLLPPVMTIKKTVPGTTDVREEFNLGLQEDADAEAFLRALGMAVAFVVAKTSFVWKLWPRLAADREETYGGNVEMAIYDASLETQGKYCLETVEGTEEVFLELEVGDGFTAQAAQTVFDRFQVSVNEDAEGVGFTIEPVTESLSKRYGRKAETQRLVTENRQMLKEATDANQ